MILLLLLVVALVALAVVFRTPLYIAIKKRTAANALKSANEAQAAGDAVCRDKYLILKAQAEADIQRAETEGWPFKK